MNVGSIVPVTCAQFGVTRVMELALASDGADRRLLPTSPPRSAENSAAERARCVVPTQVTRSPLARE